MSGQNADVLSSRPICFVVSDNGDAMMYTAYSKLISRHSPVLDKMISCGMKEDMTGEVHIDDVDYYTFVRFAKWLYGGNYCPARALIVLNDECHNEKGTETAVVRESAAAAAGNDAHDGGLVDQMPQWSSNPKGWGKKGGNANSQASSPIKNHSAPLFKLDLPQHHTAAFPVLESSSQDPDLKYCYTEVLSHVRLYAFAHKYDIQQLQHLVVHKLRDVLAQTDSHTDLAGPFLGLLALAFNSTLDLEGRELLRSLLTLFGAL